MRDYPDAALAGRADQARALRNSPEPVRRALRETRPAEKPHSH